MYFDDVTNLDELKQAYKKLCFKYHPDLGGSVEIMQAVNKEYETLLKKLAFIKNTTGDCNKSAYDWTKDCFAEIIQKIINFHGITIEVIGSWIWCFNSFEYKDQLKELGFWFSKSKKAWVYNGEAKTWKRGHYKMDEIREKWGSEKVEKQNNYIN